MEKIIIASGPVIVEDKKVLLNKHGDTAFWKFCGGRVENQDVSLIDNAKREAKEEMGIELEILDNNPFITFSRQEKNGADLDIILVHFLAKRVGEVEPGEDIQDWKWIQLADLEKEYLGPNIIPVLKHFDFIK